MCVHAGVCVHVVGYIPVYPDDQRQTWGVLRHHSLLYPIERGSLTDGGGRLTANSPLSPPSTVLSFQVHMAVPRFLHECWGFKLSASCVCGRHSYTPSHLLTSHLFWCRLCSTCTQLQTHLMLAHSASPRCFNNHCGFERRL